MRWALCTSRSRMLSARVGSPDLLVPLGSQLVSESQDFFQLSHGQPFRWQCGFLHLSSGTPVRASLSSAFRPWNRSEMIPARVPTTRRTVAGLKSESVTGFIPELWPASFRNGGRDDFGTVAALPRNTQLAERRYEAVDPEQRLV